ncbi:MAG: hypothetical protein KF750_14335 [Xanthobacteraceae bacterium]|nr:hypothetical protein [Xanthobacteraceae bacterium]
MARAGYCGTVTDEAGNIVAGASIEVRRLVPGMPLVQLFDDRTGSDTLGNPFTAETNGSFKFFPVSGGEYKVTASKVIGANLWTRTLDYVAIGTAAALDAEAIIEPGYALAFETGTDAPPGAGAIRANNADLSAATKLYVSVTDLGGSSIQQRLLELDPGTKEVKSTVALKGLIGGGSVSWLIDAADLVDDDPDYVELSVSSHDGATEIAGSVVLFREIAGGNGIPIAYLDTDGAMAANSDEKIPSQKAVRTYTATEIATAINALINAAPGALDTLKELADALGDDPNFAATMTTALAGKQPLQALLTAIAALGTVATGDLIYASGANTFSKTTLTAFIRGLLDDTDAATARATLVAAGTGVANTFSEEQSFEKFLDLPEISAPAAPSADRVRIYAKDAGGVTKLFIKDSSATETELGSGGGGSADLTPVWRNIAKIMMKMADLANNVINWIGSISDSFDTTTGLNTGGSTNMSTAEAGVIKPAITDNTSYANTGGTGDRTASITITTNASLVNGTINSLIDGGFGANYSDSTAFSSQSVAGLYIKFQFSTAKCITEAKWYQNSGTQSHGTWKWQGSNDDSAWVDIGSSFTLGGVATQTQSELTGNTAAYLYYRLLGVSGSTNTTPYLTEIEFKIGSAPTLNAMTAISAAFDLPAEPDLIDAFFVIQKIDSMTPNTDYVFSVSIDGGSNYDAGTIDEIGTVGGLTVCQVIGIDVSARTGTSLRWKLATPNADSCKLHEIMVRGY